MIITKSDDPNREHDDRKHLELRKSCAIFRQTMLMHSNDKEALRMIQDHAGQSFDGKYAAEEEQLRRANECAEERAKTIREQLRSLEQQLRAMKSHITVAAKEDIDGRPRRSFAQWSLKDQLLLSSSLFCMVLVLCAGAGNVFSAIMAEGIPVFLENPSLAVLLSCLLPSSSVALHAFAELLGTDRSKERYTIFILVLTFISVVIWTVTFGLQFQIGDNTLDLEPAGHTPAVFTITQLLTEMLCGTSLGLVATHIQSRYTKDITIPNPDAESLNQCVAHLQAEYDALLTDQRAGGRRVQLTAMRGLFISEQVAQFLAMQAFR